MHDDAERCAAMPSDAAGPFLEARCSHPERGGTIFPSPTDDRRQTPKENTMPLDPNPQTKRQDPRTLDFQIDPTLGAALYQLLQGASPTGEPLEVGWAYVTGASRLDAVEHWLLYASVDDQAIASNKRAYTWPSGVPHPVGLHFQYIRSDETLDPETYKATLEDGGRIKVVHIKATCTSGS
jgi:hypothetical protein